MNEDQQDTSLADGRHNVMEQALGAFDSLYDDAIAFIINLTGTIGRTGGDILRKYNMGPADDITADVKDAAASWGATATGMATDMATDISAALTDGLDALARLTAGLFGG